MSIGHRIEFDELSDTTLYELYSVLGDRDTPALFDQGFTLDFEHDWPTGGGNTTDRKTIGIDRTLYTQVMDGEFKSTGLEPMHLINAWIQHEHAEICVLQGDNAVDTYYCAHQRALRREHEFYQFLGLDIPKIEEAIWPALLACYERPVRKPHPDMWCGPLLHLADERDEEILAQLQKFKVKDAFKLSKYASHYGFGEKQCIDCRNYGGRKQIAPCAVITGQVRADRHCDYWQDRPVAQMAKEDIGQKLTHEAVTYGRGRGEEFCHTCHYSDHAEKPKCALVEDISPNGWCRLWTEEKL